LPRWGKYNVYYDLYHPLPFQRSGAAAPRPRETNQIFFYASGVKEIAQHVNKEYLKLKHVDRFTFTREHPEQFLINGNW
jgi:hypothetical protein